MRSPSPEGVLPTSCSPPPGWGLRPAPRPEDQFTCTVEGSGGPLFWSEWKTKPTRIRGGTGQEQGGREPRVNFPQPCSQPLLPCPRPILQTRLNSKEHLCSWCPVAAERCVAEAGGPRERTGVHPRIRGASPSHTHSLSTCCGALGAASHAAWWPDLPGCLASCVGFSASFSHLTQVAFRIKFQELMRNYSAGKLQTPSGTIREDMTILLFMP